MSRPLIVLTLLVCATFTIAPVAAAQTAVIGGTVTRDSSGQGLGDVEVSIASLGRTVRTNYRASSASSTFPRARTCFHFAGLASRRASIR